MPRELGGERWIGMRIRVSEMLSLGLMVYGFEVRIQSSGFAV